MVVAATRRTALFVFALLTTFAATWHSDSFPDDDYKHHFRERHKLHRGDIWEDPADDDNHLFQRENKLDRNENHAFKTWHQIHRNRRHKTKYELVYSHWSDWDRCNHRTCTQTRGRICLMHQLCQDSVQTDTRSCRGHRCAARLLHMKTKDKIEYKRIETDSSNSTNDTNSEIGIQIIRKNYHEKIHKPSNGTHNHHKNQHRQKTSGMHILRTQKPNKLLRAFVPTRTARGYTKWSLWSPCSKQCLTIRKRKCMRRRICGRNVIKETAYCYIEKSVCQEWVRNKIQDSKTKFVFETISSNDMADMTNFNDFEQTNMIPHGNARTDNVQCGILYGNKSSTMRSNLWSMMRIIGGRPSPKGKWVWQVVILNRFKEAFCGGTLVSLRWVLTAAHCVRKRLYIRIGEYSLSIKDDHEVEMQIKEAVIHPLYNPETVDNDVAMLRLPQAARPDRGHGIACLPHYRQPLPSRKLCTITGWGKRRSTDHFGTDTLQEAEVPIIPMETCRKTYIDYYITNNMFCAGYRRGRMDSCAGDSGGPLLCRDPTKPGEPWTIYGITSFGDGCGKRGKYGIYTRLPNYVNWINKVLKIAYFRD